MARLNIFPRLSLIIATLDLVFVSFVGASIDKDDKFHMKHLSKRPLETYEAALDLVSRRQMKEPNKMTNHDSKNKMFTTEWATVLQSSKKDFKNAFSEGRQILVLNKKTNQEELMSVGNAPIKSTTIGRTGGTFQVYKNPEMYPVARFKAGKAIHFAGFVSSKDATTLDKSFYPNQIQLMPKQGGTSSSGKENRHSPKSGGYKKPSSSSNRFHPYSRHSGRSSQHHQQKKSRWDQKPSQSRSSSPFSRGNENRHSPKG